jgi:hypothetical protein
MFGGHRIWISVCLPCLEVSMCDTRLLQWRYSPSWALTSSILWGFETFLFYGVRLSAPRSNPNMEGQVILICLGHHLSRMGHPTNSYTTASVAIRIIWPLTPHHYIGTSVPADVEWHLFPACSGAILGPWVCRSERKRNRWRDGKGWFCSAVCWAWVCLGGF